MDNDERALLTLYVMNGNAKKKGGENRGRGHGDRDAWTYLGNDLAVPGSD